MNQQHFMEFNGALLTETPVVLSVEKFEIFQYKHIPTFLSYTRYN